MARGFKKNIDGSILIPNAPILEQTHSYNNQLRKELSPPSGTREIPLPEVARNRHNGTYTCTGSETTRERLDLRISIDARAAGGGGGRFCILSSRRAQCRTMPLVTRAPAGRARFGLRRGLRIRNRFREPSRLTAAQRIISRNFRELAACRVRAF